MRRIKSNLEKATATRRGKIIAITTLLLILLASGGGILYWKIYRKEIIRDELENTIRKKTKGLYSLQYDSLGLNETAGNLALTNIKLAYDSLKYAVLLKKNDAPPILLNIEIEAIRVTGVKTPRALLDKEIVGKNVHIKNPVIEIIYTNAGKDSARNIPTKEVYEEILGGLKKIKVDTVEISGAEVITRTINKTKENLRIEKFSARLDDVAVDSAASKDPSRMLFSKQIILSAEKMSWASDNGLYKYAADSISISSATQSAYVKQFQINPTLNENAFVKSLPVQDDRFDFSFNRIKLDQLKIQELLNEKIIADSLMINSFSLKIYRDLSIRRDKKNRVGSYPHQLLSKLAVPVNIKKLILSNSYIEYKEKNPRTNQAGKVRFHNVYAALNNVTNSMDAIKENNVMRADITTRFLNKAPLKVTWKFYLNHPKGRFDITGNLGSISFTETNQLTQPMGPAKMEEGILKQLQFDFEGNDYSLNGKVKMLYDDLKISVLEKDNETKKLDKKTIASIAANIIIKNSNPDNEKEEPRVITVNIQRNTNRSIFYLTWKSLFKGIRETVGIKDRSTRNMGQGTR